ncbi:hypothetical protein M406DRAFT_322279 [Cryphonectria parasitica EP155]|uniref:Uncharacterized protein n=1 Tax=Cryphonectria parasitica (strain ATCC 38755 / EP155) TaxID=660469 RepID=A0A9P4Y4B1_CRYP1|nr:uncharacterized protein M406DRAFT_322279 [Cryphonectria parasitica EP155]KAF3766225.1 hypothetical protein M406DRAFT_322279 [Cryphonectria parasitica EP155]
MEEAHGSQRLGSPRRVPRDPRGAVTNIRCVRWTVSEDQTDDQAAQRRRCVAAEGGLAVVSRRSSRATGRLDIRQKQRQQQEIKKDNLRKNSLPNPRVTPNIRDRIDGLAVHQSGGYDPLASADLIDELVRDMDAVGPMKEGLSKYCLKYSMLLRLLEKERRLAARIRSDQLNRQVANMIDTLRTEVENQKWLA